MKRRTEAGVNWRDRGSDDRLHCCRALHVEAKADLDGVDAIGMPEVDIGARKFLVLSMLYPKPRRP